MVLSTLQERVWYSLSTLYSHSALLFLAQYRVDSTLCVCLSLSLLSLTRLFSYSTLYSYSSRHRLYSLLLSPAQERVESLVRGERLTSSSVLQRFLETLLSVLQHCNSVL